MCQQISGLSSLRVLAQPAPSIIANENLENHPPSYPAHWWKIIHLITLYTGGKSSTFLPCTLVENHPPSSLHNGGKSSTFLPCKLVKNHPPSYPAHWWKIIHLITLNNGRKSSTLLPCTLVENHPPSYPAHWWKSSTFLPCTLVENHPPSYPAHC